MRDQPVKSREMAQTTKPQSMGTQMTIAITLAYPFVASHARARLPVNSHVAPGTIANKPAKTTANWR